MAVLKKGFTDRMAEKGGITKKAAHKAVDLFIDTLMDYMAEDEKVMIKGFGRFEMKDYKEKICRSPITGEDCMIPEHKKMRFYASETLPGRIKELQGEG